MKINNSWILLLMLLVMYYFQKMKNVEYYFNLLFKVKNYLGKLFLTSRKSFLTSSLKAFKKEIEKGFELNKLHKNSKF